MQQDHISLHDPARDNAGYDGEPEKTKVLPNDASKIVSENEPDM